MPIKWTAGQVKRLANSSGADIAGDYSAGQLRAMERELSRYASGENLPEDVSSGDVINLINYVAALRNVRAALDIKD